MNMTYTHSACTAPALHGIDLGDGYRLFCGAHAEAPLAEMHPEGLPTQAAPPREEAAQ